MISLLSVYVDDPDPDWHKARSPIPRHIFFLVTQGSFTYEVDGVIYKLSKGDALFMPHGVIREGTQQPGETHQKYTILFDMKQDENLLPLLAERRTVHVKASSYDYMKQRFSILIQQWLGRMPYYETICETIAVEMLASMNRDRDYARVPSIKMAHVQAIQQYILNHFREPLAIHTLAKLVDRTPNYVTSLFKEVTGISPLTYLQQVRIAAAKDLLLHTTLTVGQVAEQLGFYDVSHFHRTFRRHTGLPPSALHQESTVDSYNSL
ncbi:helix-turn-helix domain-containing protein [Paenibacillus sp. GCM10023252]|uniref:AraC family transcriptional regulator n=1 Tax=Paenibacillus sp. GCM10023252 TaxID=3252649 RepID=UPI0036131676